MSEEQAAIVGREVGSGLYASASEVVREAIREWIRRRVGQDIAALEREHTGAFERDTRLEMASAPHRSASQLASSPALALCFPAVEQPFINIEERIDKTVGRRTKTPDALSVGTSRKADAIAWREAFGGVRVPRGVHRFRTHEEADEWLWKMIARPRPN